MQSVSSYGQQNKTKAAASHRKRMRWWTRAFVLLALLSAAVLSSQVRSDGAAAFESHEFHWAADTAASPTDRSTMDDGSITVRASGSAGQDPIVRLRWSLVDTNGTGVSGATMTLQYTTDDSWSSGVTEVGVPSDTSKKWRFRDSAFVTGGNSVTAPLLGKAHGPSAGTVFEQSSDAFSHPANRKYYEQDFSLEYRGNEFATYYFRMVINGTPVSFSSEHAGQGAIISTEPSTIGTSNYDLHGWRWATDDASRPTDRSGADDTAITIARAGSGAQDPIVRIRWAIIDPSRTGLSNSQLRVQYSTQSNWSSYAYVGDQGATGPKWRFRASPYIAQLGATVMPKLILGHNPVAGLQLEDNANTGFTLPADNRYYELDLSLEYTGNEATTYYFRLVDDNGPMSFTPMHASQGAIINVTGVASPIGQAWRWASDTAASPSDRSAADNAAISVKQGQIGAQDPVLRLRHVLHDHAGVGFSNVPITYQYSTDDSWSTGVRTVGQQGTSAEKFVFIDSSYITQLNNTSAPLLTATNGAIAGKTLEQGAASGFNQPAGFSSYENDISLKYLGDETATYYFRPVVNGVPAGNDATGGNTGPRLNTLESVVPDTTISDPTEGTLPGRTKLVTGIATDNFSLASIETRIKRSIGANQYWDGTTWDADDQWLPATITSGEGTTSATWQYSWSLDTDDATQNYTIEARAIDSAQNYDPVPSLVTVQVDNTAPTINSFAIGDGNPTYTATETNTLYNDVSGATYMRFSNSQEGLSGAIYAAYQANPSHDLTAGDGLKTVYAQFKDDSGNETVAAAAGSFDTIRLDTLAPQVGSVKPENESTGNSILGHSQLFFDEANEMDASTITESSFYLESSPDNIVVDASVQYDAENKEAILHPDLPLLRDKEYVGHITTAVKDMMGNALPAEYTWTFRTAAERVLPLGQTADTEVDESSPATNRGGEASMNIRSDAGANHRGLIIFDPSTVPADVTIEKAIMRMWMTTAPASSRNYRVQSISAGWTESDATWNERNTGVNWNTAGGDFAATVDATTATGTVDGSWVTWDVTAVARSWQDGGDNFGLIIKDASEDSGTPYQSTFTSGEGADPALHPEIIINYMKSTSTVTPSDPYQAERNTFTVVASNTGDAQADTFHEVMVTIPSGYTGIPTTEDAYTVDSSFGTWEVMTPPSGSNGPQDIIIESLGSDLPEGETVEVSFAAVTPANPGPTTWEVMSHGTEGGTETTSSTVTINEDSDPPGSVIIVPTEGTTITGDGEYIFSGTASDTESGVDSVEVSIKNNDLNKYWQESDSSWVSDPTFNVADGSTAWSYNWPKPVSDSQSFTLTVEAIDQSGNREGSSSEIDFTVDNVSPDAGISKIGLGDPEYSATTDVTLYLTALGASFMRFADASADLASVEYEPYAITASYSLPSGDGDKIVYAQFKDNFGNETLPGQLGSTDDIRLDMTPTDTTIADPLGGTLVGDSKLFSGTLTDLNEIMTADIQIVRLSDDAVWDGSTWDTEAEEIWLPATVASGSGTGTGTWEYDWALPNGDGDVDYTFFARGKDTAGNPDPSPASVTVTVDNIGPNITGFYVGIGNPLNTGARDVTLDVGVTGATQMRFAELQSELILASYSAFAPTAAFTLTTGDGIKRVFAQFKDIAGNESTAGAPGTFDDINLDTASPNGSMKVNNGYPVTNVAAVYVNNDVDDTLAGLEKMRFSNNGVLWSPWEDYAYVKSGWLMTEDAYGGTPVLGTKTVFAQYRDAAGNESSVYSDTITLREEELLQPHGIYLSSQAGGAGIEGQQAPETTKGTRFGGNSPTEATSYCLLCHDLHSAAPATNSESTDQPYQPVDKNVLLVRNQEKAVCYTCHNGTASTFNTMSDFGDNGVSEDSSKASTHSVTDGTLLCSDCHSSHMTPDNNDGDYEGNEVVRLLKSKYDTYYGYVVDALNTEWTDAEGDEENPGWKRLENPSEFCGACHGLESELEGGDKTTYFLGSSHDAGIEGPASGSGIKCNTCHAWHGSDISPLLSQTIEASAVTGNNNTVCYACHEESNGGYYPGRSIYTETAHVTVDESSIALTRWPGENFAAGDCKNCHDPHGTEYPQQRRADRNILCYICHDAASTTKPSDYNYRGTSAYEATPHATDSSANNVFPVTGDSAETQQAGECTNCHGVMGMDDGAGNPIANLMLRKEEATCYGGSGNSGACHAKEYEYSDAVDEFYSSTGTRSINIYDAFNPTIRFETTGPTSGAKVNSVHDISDSDQSTYNPGAKIECTSCHNSHLNQSNYDFSTASRFSDPDNINRNWTERYSKDGTFVSGVPYSATPDIDVDPSFGKALPDFVRFCLRCHDGAPASGVTFGTPAPTNISNAYANSDTNDAEQHGRGDGTGGVSGVDRGTLKLPYTETVQNPYAAMNCYDCHDIHSGDGSPYKLRSNITINGTVMTTSLGASTFNVLDNTYGGIDGWCSFCHDISNHADAEGTECGTCHSHAANSF